MSLAALAITTFLSASVVACADSDQPDKYEAFGGSGQSTSTSDLTSSTASSAETDASAAKPKTDSELQKEDEESLSNHASKSRDNTDTMPLKGN